MQYLMRGERGGAAVDSASPRIPDVQLSVTGVSTASSDNEIRSLLVKATKKGD